MSKLNRRTIAVIAAVFLAAAATGLVFVYVSSVKQDAAEQEEMATVLVAKEAIPANTSGESIVEKGLFERQQLPQRAVAPGAFAGEAELQEKVLEADLPAGQQLVEAQFVQRGTEGVLEIPPGMRAFSITIDRSHAVAGMIKPGDFVDIIATFEFETFNKSNIPVGPSLSKQEVNRVKTEFNIDLNSIRSDLTRTLAQRVQVLQIDPVDSITAQRESDEGDADVPDSPVAVLLLDPYLVEKVTFAQEIGTISLALRSAEDDSVLEIPGRTPANEFHRTPQEPQPGTNAQPTAQTTSN